MARSKSDGVNKSQAIRDALTANPKAKSREIVALLAQKGIKVAPTLVYFVKSKMRQTRRRQKKEQAASASRMFGIADPVNLILKVKALAAETGGIANLKKLVDVLAG